jgi:hypothetical protein
MQAFESVEVDPVGEDEGVFTWKAKGVLVWDTAPATAKKTIEHMFKEAEASSAINADIDMNLDAQDPNKTYIFEIAASRDKKLETHEDPLWVRNFFALGN